MNDYKVKPKQQSSSSPYKILKIRREIKQNMVQNKIIQMLHFAATNQRKRTSPQFTHKNVIYIDVFISIIHIDWGCGFSHVNLG
jgi:predicted 2-oxoglutarate/Fe(II)-dependent dioxygenase YbiX